MFRLIFITSYDANELFLAWAGGKFICAAKMFPLGKYAGISVFKANSWELVNILPTFPGSSRCPLPDNPQFSRILSLHDYGPQAKVALFSHGDLDAKSFVVPPGNGRRYLISRIHIS